MELLHFDALGPTAAPTRVVLLPGAYSTPQDFVDEGFVAALRAQAPAVDVVVAGTRIEHYADGSAVERLQREVIDPARERGVRALWLVGISLGAMLALGCAARRSAPFAGLLLLGPYLGARPLLAEIDAAGGAEAWAAARPPRPDDLLEHEVWRWLSTRPAAPPIHLGTGSSDRFIEAQRRLAAQLPPGHAVEVPGGHDWPVWRTLWRGWLARGRLAVDSS